MKQNSKIGWAAVLILLVIQSCKEKVEPIYVMRFEQDLFQNTVNNSNNTFAEVQKKYGYFFQSFGSDILGLKANVNDPAFNNELNEFIHYPTIAQLKHEVDSVFPNLTEVEKDLSKSMAIYKKEFPTNKVPTFVSFLSEFAFANVTYDTIIGIGLDMYLGSTYPLYPALEFPDFMVAKLRKEYIVSNAIKALAIGKFEHELRDKRFISMMLFEGKVRYFMKQLMPELSDTIIFSCSQKQLVWAKENEAMIWAHLIENKMLFNTEPNQYMRYFNDGPFTIATGVPQESAPGIGVFAGFNIVEKYMKEHNNVSLEELMLNANWDEILKQSSYKPK